MPDKLPWSDWPGPDPAELICQSVGASCLGTCAIRRNNLGGYCDRRNSLPDLSSPTEVEAWLAR